MPATPAHAADIAAVHVRAWRAAYADILAPDFLAGRSAAHARLRRLRGA